MNKRKMFVIAHNKSLKGVVSNKGVLWEAIKSLLNITEEELDSKERGIKICGMSETDLKTRSFLAPTEKKLIYKKHYLYNIFKEHKNVIVFDEEEKNKVSIYEKTLNEISGLDLE